MKRSLCKYVFFAAFCIASCSGGAWAASPTMANVDDVPAPVQRKIELGPLDRYCQRWQTQLRLAWTEKRPEFSATHLLKVSVDKSGKILAVESAEPNFKLTTEVCAFFIAMPPISSPPAATDGKPLTLIVALNNDTSAIKVWSDNINWSAFEIALAKQFLRCWYPPRSYTNSGDEVVGSFWIHRDGSVTNIDLKTLPMIVERSIRTACANAAQQVSLPDGAPDTVYIDLLIDLGRKTEIEMKVTREPRFPH